MTRSHSASLTSAAADMRSMIPALFTSTSTPPKRSTAVAVTWSTTACSLRSPVTATAVPPACSISLTDRLGRLGVEVRHQHAGSLRGEGQGGRPPDARARPGDDDTASVESAGHEVLPDP